MAHFIKSNYFTLDFFLAFLVLLHASFICNHRFSWCVAAEPPPSKPRFISRFEPDLRLPDGEPLTLKCKVEGYPLQRSPGTKTGYNLRMSPIMRSPAETVTTNLGYLMPKRTMEEFTPASSPIHLAKTPPVVTSQWQVCSVLVK